MNKIFKIVIFFIQVAILSSSDVLPAADTIEYWDRNNTQSLISIRSQNGKFYASIVLLFNENPHFINLIQEDSISQKMIQKPEFQVKAYKSYLSSLKKSTLKDKAELMLDVYLHPDKYDDKTLNSIEHELNEFNVILRFSKISGSQGNKTVLDYCIFGRKELVNITHPLFNIKEKIYNIQPFIYYDEFSTSNSTFYFDMIYINPEEVHNDYLIAKLILQGKDVDSMFFVGTKVNDEIKFCILKAFDNSKSIKDEILKMFQMHELTHKILNNHYDYYDHVTGEELALMCPIYENPYLGLSVMYSYLEYNSNNPHRIAAMNYIRFIANRTGRLDLIDNPSDIKFLKTEDIKRLSMEHFNSIVKNLK